MELTKTATTTVPTKTITAKNGMQFEVVDLLAAPPKKSSSPSIIDWDALGIELHGAIQNGDSKALSEFERKLEILLKEIPKYDSDKLVSLLAAYGKYEKDTSGVIGELYSSADCKGKIGQVIRYGTYCYIPSVEQEISAFHWALWCGDVELITSYANCLRLANNHMTTDQLIQLTAAKGKDGKSGFHRRLMPLILSKHDCENFIIAYVGCVRQFAKVIKPSQIVDLLFDFADLRQMFNDGNDYGIYVNGEILSQVVDIIGADQLFRVFCLNRHPTNESWPPSRPQLALLNGHDKVIAAYGAWLNLRPDFITSDQLVFLLGGKMGLAVLHMALEAKQYNAVAEYEKLLLSLSTKKYNECIDSILNASLVGEDEETIAQLQITIALIKSSRDLKVPLHIMHANSLNLNASLDEKQVKTIAPHASIKPSQIHPTPQHGRHENTSNNKKEKSSIFKIWKK